MDALAEKIKATMDFYFATVSDEQFKADLEACGWREYAELESMAFNRIVAQDCE